MTVPDAEYTLRRFHERRTLWMDDIEALSKGSGIASGTAKIPRLFYDEFVRHAGAEPKFNGFKVVPHNEMFVQLES